jgi:hypothetical protein
VGLAFAFFIFLTAFFFGTTIFLTAFLADIFLGVTAFFFVTFGSAFFLREGLGVEVFLGDDLGVVTFFGVACRVFTPAFFGLDFGELDGVEGTSADGTGAGSSAGAVSASGAFFFRAGMKVNQIRLRIFHNFPAFFGQKVSGIWEIESSNPAILGAIYQKRDVTTQTQSSLD